MMNNKISLKKALEKSKKLSMSEFNAITRKVGLDKQGTKINISGVLLLLKKIFKYIKR